MGELCRVVEYGAEGPCASPGVGYRKCDMLCSGLGSGVPAEWHRSTAVPGDHSYLTIARLYTLMRKVSETHGMCEEPVTWGVEHWPVRDCCGWGHANPHTGYNRT